MRFSSNPTDIKCNIKTTKQVDWKKLTYMQLIKATLRDYHDKGASIALISKALGHSDLALKHSI